MIPSKDEEWGDRVMGGLGDRKRMIPTIFKKLI